MLRLLKPIQYKLRTKHFQNIPTENHELKNYKYKKNIKNIIHNYLNHLTSYKFIYKQ